MKLKKSLSLVLALLMTAGSFAACKDGDNETEEFKVQYDADGNVILSEGSFTPAEYEGMEYYEKSEVVYEAAVGTFYEAYQDALAEVDDMNLRYAQMAIAEAKFLESGVIRPNYTEGGNYAIGRLVPYTVPYASWGTDSYRLYQVMTTNEIIKTEDRNALKALWNEVKGTGTYLEKAEEYLLENGYTLKDTYRTTYTAGPETFDILDSSRSTVSEPLSNCYDGLAEYDVEGTLQPALAESWTVSEDGLTYTFKLREGVKWVDSQGREVAEVVADDFVAGMQHMIDTGAGLDFIVDGVIAGVSAYINGETTDFSTVGVKAIDKYTVQYTLEEAAPYFLSMIEYCAFAPMSRTYYESQGGKFGAEYDKSVDSYLYGKSADNIAYCGPYLITNYTEDSMITFTANESYWNKDAVNNTTITWLYNDGSDTTKSYNDMVAGTIDAAGLNSSTVELAKADGNFDKYKYTTSGTAATFVTFYNLAREAYVNFNDGVGVKSTKSDAENERTTYAMGNAHFRLAVSMATDTATIQAQSVGEDLKYAALRNSYTPADFVQLTEDVEIEINGEKTKFEAGTYYGQIMQAQLDADGVKIMVWNPEANDGFGGGDGYDGWYNPENAAEELEKAILELAALGVVVDENNPIYIDLPYYTGSTLRTNMANAYKQSIESALGGKVILNLVACEDVNDWYNTGYYTNNGYEANYDIYELSGWTPDYNDPCSYLNTFLPDGAGYMAKCCGIY